MSSIDNENVTWFRITERNEWEGETWYHYFKSADGVYSLLLSAVERSDGELEGPKTAQLTWDQAATLTNQDDDSYMQTYWFGELTDFDGLSKADDKKLYKGGIRNFGEELFVQGEEE